MRLSLNWLKDFVEIPKSVTPEKLGELLTLHTVEVEKVERQADKYKKVVVGKILAIKPHPKADKLRLAIVDTGTAAGTLEIVCGAPNIAAGQLVPVALVGAILPNGAEIKPAEIRGVKSNGMLCAEDELGLGEDQAGILILGEEKSPLPPDKTSPLIPLLIRRGKGAQRQGEAGVKLGQPFADYLKLDDVVFEVDNKSLTHRADLWSHYGLARDMAAFLNVKFKPMKTPPPPFERGDKKGFPLYKGDKKALLQKEGQGRFYLGVRVEDFKLCPRYMAVGLENLKVAPSPKWLSDRLSACGMRPINNIVDATNYVMLELGQPLHAFDKTRIRANEEANESECKIIVRRAKNGETMETLDGVKRKLDADMLVIADKTKPVAIAGVMGGANSEINEKTESIIIESANFNFASVRQTAQKLGLRTEASMRFEKGLDPNLCELGLNRVVEIITKICPSARLAGNLVDEKQTPLIPLLKGDGKGLGPIKFDLAWLNKFIGQEFSFKYVKQVLEKLGFKVKIATRLSLPAETKSRLSVTIPTWRAIRDVAIREDIVEEVARIYGYNNIRPRLPKIDLAPPLAVPEKQLARKIKNILSVGAGLTEVYNYSFVDKAGVESIKLANPLSEDLKYLRDTLLRGLEKNIKTNQANEAEIGIYEIGSIFLNKPGEIKKDDSGKETLPFEEKRLALALAGLPARQAGDASDDLFRKLKGVIEFLFESLNLEVSFVEAKPPFGGLASMAGAAIYSAGVEIGRVGEVDSATAAAFGLKKKAAMAEISLAKLVDLVKNQIPKQYAEPPKYPSASRDLALVVNEKILYNNIVKQIKKFSALIKEVELFDVYAGGQLSPGKKSLAFHIIYQADKTLTSAEVDEAQGKLVKHLEKEFKAKVRDF